jgi:tRNA modification GTPase
MENSTIAAIATPQGSGGIGIVRISGPDAARIGSSVFSRSNPECEGQNPEKNPSAFSLPSSCSSAFQSHRLNHGYIVNPENGTVLDEVLMVLMKAPHSYTTEDVVEIQAHCNPFVLRSILDLVIKQGARIAQPGEFTKRAYLNGRIDLTQAEAVIDIINARTTNALNVAISQIRGGLKMKVEAARQVLVDLLTEIEAVIDFPDDVKDILAPDHALEKIQLHVVNSLQELIENYESAHFLRDGFKLVIVGAPNVGKSSLMNLLMNKERSIVTSIPGTTRDLIEDSFNLDGIPIVLTDTAGFHETADPVECIGIQKAQQYIDQSDLVLLMLDASSDLTPEDLKLFNDLSSKRLILVFNKTDLADQNLQDQLPDFWKNLPKVYISALLNKGIDDLKRVITELIIGELPDRQDTIVPNLRHKIALEKALRSVASIRDGLGAGFPYELIAIDARESVDILEEILGITAKLDVLDNIFSNFCIGK